MNGSRSDTPATNEDAVPAAFREQLTSIKLTVSRTSSPEPVHPADSGSITPIAVSKPRSNSNGKGKEKAKDIGEKEAERKTSSRNQTRKDSIGEGKTKAPERQSTFDVLGMGTPEVRRWVQAGEFADDDPNEPRAGRRVGFLTPNGEPDALEGIEIQSIEIMEDDPAHLRPVAGDGDTIKMTVQISPRRPAKKLTPSTSPMRTTTALPGMGAGLGQPGANSAHDLLHTLILDALYDFRRETKAEIIGLHLDLVKMGRGWRKEMRDALDQWSEELREVRDENRRLREENERLRRGY